MVGRHQLPRCGLDSRVLVWLFGCFCWLLAAPRVYAQVDTRPPRNFGFRGGRVHTSLKNVQRRQAPSPPATVSQQLDKQAQTYYKRLIQHANLPAAGCYPWFLAWPWPTVIFPEAFVLQPTAQ